MNIPPDFQPTPADATIASREGENWTLVLTRYLKHPPEKVWRALTNPEDLRQWAPFDPDRDMGALGPVSLTTVGMAHVAETKVTRAEAPRLLEFNWGGGDVRWELERLDSGTRLTLWATIDRRFVAMGAAGWHLCLDVMARFLADAPVGRIVAKDALEYGGWQHLHQEYRARFEIASPEGPQ